MKPAPIQHLTQYHQVNQTGRQKSLQVKEGLFENFIYESDIMVEDVRCKM